VGFRRSGSGRDMAADTAGCVSCNVKLRRTCLLVVMTDLCIDIRAKSAQSDRYGTSAFFQWFDIFLKGGMGLPSSSLSGLG